MEEQTAPVEEQAVPFKERFQHAKMKLLETRTEQHGDKVARLYRHVFVLYGCVLGELIALIVQAAHR